MQQFPFVNVIPRYLKCYFRYRCIMSLSCNLLWVLYFIAILFVINIFASVLGHWFGSIFNKITREIPHQLVPCPWSGFFLSPLLIVHHDAAHFSRPPPKAVPRSLKRTDERLYITCLRNRVKTAAKWGQLSSVRPCIAFSFNSVEGPTLFSKRV
jgi:hypothetical protein